MQLNNKPMTLQIKVYEHLTIEAQIIDGKLKFKTPKAYGGRFYYQLCNDLDIAIQEQYPEVHKLINQ